MIIKLHHYTVSLCLLCITTMVNAEEYDSSKEIQDMSDPLAVYTQLGAGYTDKGFNLKAGKAYDSGKPATMAVNIFELQGILGDSTGIRDNQTDSADSARFRNLIVDTVNGQGSQVDISWDFNSKTGSASYSLIQALPKVSIFNFYPLAGLGMAVANNVNNHPLWSDADSPSGISMPGAFASIGMYSKMTITKKIWFNYNPVWLSSIAGSENYTKNTYGLDESNVLTHEAALSYQITPVFNVRYFGNWSDNLDFKDGDHRVELNYQI